jgi:pimeloyl-ACP methyl ester carboxylesterase
MQHQVHVVESVASQIGSPVHLVGHSFGGTIAFASALSGAFEVASITTFEANPFRILRENGQTQMFEATQRVATEFEAAYNAGEPDAARRIIDFWGGEQSFRLMPGAVQDYCRSTTYANVLDWRTAFNFEATMADYAQLKMPVLLVRGGLANPVMVEITDALRVCLPNAQTAVVSGASHFLNTSHAESCSRLLSDFLERI